MVHSLARSLAHRSTPPRTATRGRAPLALLAALLPLAGCAIEPRPADLVLSGGTVWTGVEGAPLASGVVVRAGRIVHVGSDREVERFIGPSTHHIPLRGRLVVPGFIDNHTHFIDGGFQLGSVDLRDAATPAAFARRIGDFSAKLPAGRWITGGDWDHERWGGELPRREWIDSLTTERPVLVARHDGHMALANSHALALAGITRETADPPGGTIVRDPRTGEPTGVLKDEAMELVGRLIPEPTESELDEAFRRAQMHTLALGVTMINDMGGWASLETYRRAQRNGELNLRVYSLVPLRQWERLRDYMAREGRGNDRLKWGGVKGFVDGSLGSTTAWFYEPYTDAPETTGLVMVDTLFQTAATAFRKDIFGADSAGIQLAVHAIGDRANDWILDLFAEVARTNGPRDRRARIEHAQHVKPATLPRFRELGVIPSMQPYHAIDDGRWADKRIGAERSRTTYAFRALLDTGATLTFGSDWTVAPIDPLLGIYAAVTRRTLDDRHPDGWVPEQKITLEEALRAYTTSNAYAAFAESRIGALTEDRLADLVVLSEDLFQIDPTRIPAVRVDYTVIDGKVVYQRPTIAKERPAR